MNAYATKLEVFGLFLISFLIFVWPNPVNEIIGFESRFYVFALDMWRHGISWFPTTYQQPYPDYPGTSTWVIYGLAKLFGHLNKWIAVLPSAIGAALTVVLTYLIGCLQSKRWGLSGVCFLLLTITFLKSARSLSLDVYPLLFTTWCFYLVYSADVQQKPQRAYWIYLLMFLSFAFRGPIGLVMPAGVVCIYYLLNKNVKQFFVSGVIALCLLALSTVGLLALAEHVGGAAFRAAVLRMQVVGRIDNPYLPFHFYFTGGLGNNALSFPLACLTIVGFIYYSLRRVLLPYKHMLLQLLGWMLVILIGMSIPGDKKIRYVLPMLPAAALLAAYPFSVVNTKKYFIYFQKLGSCFFLFFPAFLFIVTEILFFYQKQKLSGLSINYGMVLSLLMVLQFLNLWLRYSRATAKYIIPLAATSFVIFYISVIERVELYIDKAYHFVTAIEKLRIEQHAQLVFYKERSDGLPIKYLVNMQQEEVPIFIEDQKALAQYKTRAFFVTSDTYFEELPKDVIKQFTIVANDTLGHNRVVIFTQRSL
ncbi:MAG: glycosyltransferase family 39 protein [Gammaproteobacteria bacterium]